MNKLGITTISLGCRLNEAEASQSANALETSAFDAGGSPIQIINTCAVTAEASAKSRRAIRQARKQHPDGKIVVTGCYATLEPEQTAQLGADLVVKNADKDQLAEQVIQAFGLLSAEATPAHSVSIGESNRQRAFIKVQDGCRYQCTFCVTTLARGEERSRSIADIIADIRQQQAKGFNEAVLTGVHLGGYGSDNHCSLAQLLSSILEQTDCPRLRLGSLEPWSLAEDFWQLFERYPDRLMPHLHLAFQSGSNRILKKMARRGSVEHYRDLIARGRSINADFNFTTDIIAGFPGETLDDWQRTLDFVHESQFGHVHVFPFSANQRTFAATLADQVSSEERKRRAQQLRSLAGEIKLAQLRQQRGKTLDLLLETEETNTTGSLSYWSGLTPNYYRALVKMPAKLNLGGKVVRCRIVGTDFSGEKLIAEPI